MSNPNNQQTISDPFIDQINDIAAYQEQFSTEFNNEYDSDAISSELQSYRVEEVKEYIKELEEAEKKKGSNKSEEEQAAEKQTEEEMAEAQECSIGEIEYVVRGAYMRCTYGSHCRRLNLPKCHGEFKEGRPLMNDKDSIPGTKEICATKWQQDQINIPYFGVCKEGKSPGEKIYLLEDSKRDPFGNVIEETKKQAWYKKTNNVVGPVCIPTILSNWLSPSEYVQIGDGHAISTRSFAVCQYGGIIEILQSGQGMDDNIDTLDEE